MASSPPDTFFRGYPQNLLMSIFDILIGNDLNTDKGEVGGSSPPRPTISLKFSNFVLLSLKATVLGFGCESCDTLAIDRKPRPIFSLIGQFWQSFRTSRDLVLVGLMLLDGLLSCEVLRPGWKTATDCSIALHPKTSQRTGVSAIIEGDRIASSRNGTWALDRSEEPVCSTSPSRACLQHGALVPTVRMERYALREIKEADWKVLKRLHRLAVERFCERVLAEVERVMHNSTESASQRYRNIFRIVERRDRDIARLFNGLRRSQGLMMLARICSEGLLTEDEFSSLSPETRSVIEMLLDRD
jgi:hypothetical protein